MSEKSPTVEIEPSRHSRWKRRLRIGASVCFGLLAVVLCVLWVRSYSWLDWIEAQRSGIYTNVGSVNGGVRIDLEPGDDSFCILRLNSIRLDDPTVQGFPNQTLRFAWISREQMDLIIVPHWCLATVATAASAVTAIGWKGRFSLRSLLLATTLVAVVLGLVVWMAR